MLTLTKNPHHYIIIYSDGENPKRYFAFGLFFFLIYDFNEISDSQTSLVDARRNPTNQIGRRLTAVFQVSIFLNGIADVRSFMAAVVHRHNLLTRKRDKNATPSVALSDSIGIRNATVINIGSLALVKTGIYQLFQVFTDVYLKLQRVDSVFVFVISFFLHTSSFLCLSHPRLEKAYQVSQISRARMLPWSIQKSLSKPSI